MKTINVNVTKWNDQAGDYVEVPMMGYVVSVEHDDDATCTWVYVPGYISTGADEYWTVETLMHGRELTEEEEDLMWDELGEDVMMDMEAGYAIPVYTGGVADEEQAANLSVRMDSTHERTRGCKCVRTRNIATTMYFRHQCVFLL